MSLDPESQSTSSAKELAKPEAASDAVARNFHRENWLLGVYPQAWKNLEIDWTLMILLPFAVVCLIETVVPAVSAVLNLYLFVGVTIATSVTLYRHLSILRNASWCLKHLEPIEAQMKLFTAVRPGRLVICLADDVDVFCTPNAGKKSKLLTLPIHQLTPVQVWLHPISKLPVVLDYEGELIIVRAHWSSPPLTLSDRRRARG